jgi:predicted DNA-binding WGR domain protein
LYVSGNKNKFYVVSLLNSKDVTISLGRINKGTVLVRRTAGIQVRKEVMISI